MVNSKPAPNLALQRERFRKQMARAELARQTGISAKALNEIEKRKTGVRLANAAKIATALDCEVLDLFEPTEVIG